MSEITLKPMATIGQEDMLKIQTAFWYVRAFTLFNLRIPPVRKLREKYNTEYQAVAKEVIKKHLDIDEYTDWNLDFNTGLLTITP